MSDRNIVEMLRAIKAREWVSEDDLAYLGTLVRWVTATSEGPCVNGKALVLNESGKEVLALAEECERWRLRSAWKEKTVERMTTEADDPERKVLIRTLVAGEIHARDAYIAAGGVD